MLHGYPHPAKAQLIPKVTQLADDEKWSDTAAIYNEIKTLAHANRWQLNRLLGNNISMTFFHGVIHNFKFAVT